jgi:serine/threonine protein phosphatase PrpC
MKQQDELIFKLIFSKEKDFIILVSDYIGDIYRYDYFIKEIKDILKKSKVMVVKENIEVSLHEVKWKIKVKK